MDGEIRITVIATGFSPKTHPAIPPQIAKKAQPNASSPPRPSITPPPPTIQPENKFSKPGLDIPDFLQRRRPPK
jgi:cell division protein FtsZ